MQDAVPATSDGSRTILGVRLRDVRREEAISLIDATVARGDMAKVCFANAKTLNSACDNERYKSTLEDFIVLNDGIGVDIASRLKYGTPFAENLNGTDFLPAYLAGTKLPLRIYLIGSSDAVVGKAAEILGEAYPQHKIAGYRNGFFESPQSCEQTCTAIRDSGANCVLVGMGNPLQELWIEEHGRDTGAKLFFGVGAFFDFQAGHIPRAPDWVRKLRCEWLFRLSQEPVRLARRYLIGNFVFLGRALLDARR